MAKTLAALVLGAALMAGCQQQTAMIDTLPAPTFDGPNTAPARPAPVMVRATPPVAPAPPKAEVKPAPFTGIPTAWVPSAAVKPRPWQWIVVHHSDTAGGGAAAFDRFHKDKGWDELGYHFVIGNGTDTADGQVEVGPRWPKQKWGAHAKTPDNRFNDFGIGICLVGNFDNTHPTAAQMRSLVKLVAYLEKTYHIPSDRVLGHRDTKSTDCPGRYMDVAAVRSGAKQLLADMGAADEPAVAPTRTASIDLLHSIQQ